jgi:uncharacterized protein (TIGR03083 family)
MLTYDRYRAEIVTQTELLTATIKGADLTTPVPSCPGWNTGQLLRHLGEAQRWATKVIRSRAREAVPEHDAVRSLGPLAADAAATIGPWLAERAADLSTSLREAGPGVELWTPVPSGRTDFFARRFTHETAMHRADATLALGARYELDPDVATDAIDEWLELGSLPFHFEVHPWMKELLGPDRTIHFHATDTPAEWVLDLTGDAITWRRAHEKSTAALRGPVTDLLLVIYKRRPPETVEVIGDQDLVRYWLERVSFG